MKRREFIVGLGAAAWPLAARAQQAERVRLIGVLSAGGLNEPIALAAFREELAKLGWVEGRSLRIDYRTSGADPDRLAAGQLLRPPSKNLLEDRTPTHPIATPPCD